MKILCLSLVIFCGNYAFGQAQKINGVGELRLGKTEAQILQILHLDKNKIIDKDTLTDNELLYYYAANTVVRVAPISKNHTDYHIPAYNFANNVLHNISLTFYEDTLIAIHTFCEKNDINEAFTNAFKDKYTDYKNYDWSYESSSGFQIQEGSRWNSGNENIKVECGDSGLEPGYNSKAEAYSYFSFFIENTKKLDEMNETPKSSVF